MPEVITVNRLSKAVYDDLVKKLPQMAVTNDTSPMHAGMQIGIQLVLKHLREGYVRDEHEG